MIGSNPIRERALERPKFFFFRYAAPRARSERTKCAVVMSEFSPIFLSFVLSSIVSLTLFGVPFLVQLGVPFLIHWIINLTKNNCIFFLVSFQFLLLIGGFGRIGFDSHSPFVVKKKRRRIAMMKIGFPFVKHRSRMYNFLVRISMVFFLVTLYYAFCLIMEKMHLFFPIFWKVGLALGSRALSFALFKLGLSGGLALAIAFFVKGILTAEGTGMFMMPNCEGTSGEKLPLPARDESPVPSISSQGDSWIEKTYGKGDEASSLGPPLPGHPANPPSIQDFANLLDNHQKVAAIIQDIHREISARVPGGFQSERLSEILEERHGGAKMREILESLATDRRDSPYFREVQTDFKILRGSGGTEAQLRREWQGRT